MKYIMFVLLCFSTCGELSHLTAQEHATNSIRFEAPDFLMKIEWFGAVTKPVYEATLATTNRIQELENWKVLSEHYHITAIVSKQEVYKLEQLFQREMSLQTGPTLLPQHKQQYILSITSGSNAYHLELGFSKKMIPLLKQIANALSSQSAKPVESVIRQAARRQDE